jgi:hypothetical protein
MTTLSTRADGRRSKSTNGRNRETWGDYGAARSTRVLIGTPTLWS